MDRLARLSGIAALLACLYAGWLLAQALRSAPSESGPEAFATQPDTTAPSSTAGTAARDWPAVFGLAEPQPPATPEAEPQPPAPPFNTPLTLRGLMSDGAQSWAILGDPGGQTLLVHVGDSLEPGVSVAEIRLDGLLLDTPSGPVMLGFEP